MLRQELHLTWLDNIGFGQKLTVAFTACAGGLRCYWRISWRGGRRHIVMDAPPKPNNIEALVAIWALFSSVDVPHRFMLDSANRVFYCRRSRYHHASLAALQHDMRKIAQRYFLLQPSL